MNSRNPQSWNRYAYVENDPINGVDPHGLYVQAPDDIGDPFGSGDLGCILAHWDDPFAFGCFGGGYVSVPNTQSNREIGTLDSLVDQGVIAGWSFVNGGVNEFALSFDSDTYPIAVGVCVAQPDICAAAAGVGLIIVYWPELQQLIDAIRHQFSKTRWMAGSFPTPDEVKTNCTPIGHPISVPSTRRGNRGGGKSIEQEYLCPDGNTYTIHTVEDKNGRIIDQHVRPGPPKYGDS